MENIEKFYEEYENIFEEYLESIKRNLRNSNKKYIELKNEYRKILNENNNLALILDGDIEGKNLSKEECVLLSKLVQIYIDMQSIEEQEIFFLGGKIAYYFLERIGVLK